MESQVCSGEEAPPPVMVKIVCFWAVWVGICNLIPDFAVIAVARYKKIRHQSAHVITSSDSALADKALHWQMEDELSYVRDLVCAGFDLTQILA